MKLILTTDVPGLGAPGDIVEVRDGYGRNYLLPQGKAIVATKGAEKQVATIKRAQLAREIRGTEHANEVAGALGKRTVTVKADAPATAASSSARSPRSTSPTPSGRPAARRSTGAPSIPRAHQDRRLAPGARSSCTPGSPPRWRSPSSRADLHGEGGTRAACPALFVPRA